MIDKQTEAAVKSDGFATIERPLLEALVERDTLEIEEVELFKGVIEWATKESEKRGVVADGQEKKKNSWRMDRKSLTLSRDEARRICLSGYPVTKRSGSSNKFIIRCRRFNSVKFGWKYLDRQHRLAFSVDDDILFHGVNLFGSKDNTYSVNLELNSGLYFKKLLATRISTFPSVVDVSGEYYCFDVLFENPIPLKKDVNYSLDSEITGPNSWYGTQSHQTQLCSGIKFTLNSDYSLADNKTGISTQGQFNELIFSYCK